MTRILVCLGFPLLFSVAARGAVETYKIDPAHSSVAFHVRHFFTPVTGSFVKFAGTITVDRDNLEQSSVEATIESTSVSTANERRDKHLRSDDFFDVEKYPQLTFSSTSWKKTGENTFDVTGDLTIRDVTKPVTLQVRLLGFGPGGRGAMLSGWEASTTLNRKDFGVDWGPPGMLSDEVEVTIAIEARRLDT